ncbi:hypothetical protein A2778_05095 [Candidatus Daviesbacteria bacterium RIFCSPHIGHO2_01_FULL_40_24]|nr:MAG: hypothetical protein A2778_05095 [Candidatus Daviesbacteria bacterium RIFCSPHIGHO2_01_FULL_40_24]OGE43634.1 MAG: hypothetical protein A3A53_03320 [Candidatus Daviesbacteria bacterium RIFCSPLOWO2_01_FULL_39_23]
MIKACKGKGSRGKGIASHICICAQLFFVPDRITNPNLQQQIDASVRSLSPASRGFANSCIVVVTLRSVAFGDFAANKFTGRNFRQNKGKGKRKSGEATVALPRNNFKIYIFY